MSFFSSFKRAFGFGADIDDDIDDDVTLVEATPSLPEKSVENKTTPPEVDNSATKAENDTSSVPPLDTTLAGDLFDGVLEVFNTALPDFLKKAVDGERQRQQLIDQLDKSLSNRLAAVLEASRKQGLQEIADERNRTAQEIKRIRELNKTLDDRQRETNAAKLSSERQKRALKERVNDLENQVLALEAEKEQYQLETKSMLNRMRAASVAGTAEGAAFLPDPETERRAKELQENLDNSRNEIARLSAEIENKNAEISSLKSSRDALNDDNEKLHKAFEQQKAKQELSDAMINSLQSKSSEALQRAEELEKKLAENNVSTEQLNEIENQLIQFSELKEKLDKRIKDLKTENQDLRTQIDEFQAQINKSSATNDSLCKEIEILKATIAENLSVHAEAMAKVSDELSEARSELSKANAKLTANGTQTTIPELTADTTESYAAHSSDQPKTKGKNKKRKSNPRLSAIEQSIENNDWFGAPTEDEIVPKVASDKSDDDFGYKTPPRKNIPENSDQMSLW